MIMYEIVWTHPGGKTEEVIKRVRTLTEITLTTETPKYLGTWLNDHRKLLRWNRGELHIREVEMPLRIIGMELAVMGAYTVYRLEILHGEELSYILLNNYTMVGYTKNKTVLWQTNNFTLLADILGKDAAYKCLQYYEQYQKHFDVKGAM